MHYTIQKLPNEPITIWTPMDEWDWVADSPESNAKVVALWDASDEAVYHIANTQHYNWNLEGLTTAAASAAFGENPLFTHPKLKGVIIVTQDPKVLFAINAVVESMKGGGSLYRSSPVLAMSTLEEALAYIRKDRGAK